MKPGPAISIFSIEAFALSKFATNSSAIIRGAFFATRASCIAIFVEKSPFVLSFGDSNTTFGICSSVANSAFNTAA